MKTLIVLLIIASECSCYLSSSHSNTSPQRLDKSSLAATSQRIIDLSNPDDIIFFKEHIDGKQPAILRNAFQVDNDQWTSKLVTICGDSEIEYDVRYSESGEIESYACTMGEFIKGIFDGSDHEESMYLMNEDILNEEGGESLLNPLQLQSPIFGHDLFQYFPRAIRPKMALIIGGVGARSFLHGDPYEWTGINYLFEGEKLWTFIPPKTTDGLFMARRNSPDAWGPEFSISAGWVSDDVDLYKHVMVKDKKKKLGGLNSIFQRNKPISSNGDKKVALPMFSSGLDQVDYCDESLVSGAVQLLQKEGDLIIIPPRWWHQVYHLQPSIAIASQYANENNKDRLYNHIGEWCSTSFDEDILASLSLQQQIGYVIQSAILAKNGEEEGNELIDSLFITE